MDTHDIHNIIAPLLAEEAKLEAELRQSPLFRRLEAVKASIVSLRAAYSEPVAVGLRTDKYTVGRSAPASPRARQPGSLTSRITKIASDAMASTNQRYTSAAIVALAIGEGLAVPGRKPQSVVASMLSHNELFDNKFDSYGAGYGLRRWSQPIDPNMNEAPNAETEGAS